MVSSQGIVSKVNLWPPCPCICICTCSDMRFHIRFGFFLPIISIFFLLHYIFSSSFSIKLRKVNTLKKIAASLWGPANRASFFIIQSWVIAWPSFYGVRHRCSSRHGLFFCHRFSLLRFYELLKKHCWFSNSFPLCCTYLIRSRNIGLEDGSEDEGHWC